MMCVVLSNAKLLRGRPVPLPVAHRRGHVVLRSFAEPLAPRTVRVAAAMWALARCACDAIPAVCSARFRALWS